MRQGYGHMLVDEMVHRVREMRIKRSARLSALRTTGDATEFQRHARQAIRLAFGAWPTRTPLNAHTSGIVERPGYRIEKMLFESRPGCLVTGNLYLPDHLDQPAPCVLATCGHAAEGKGAVLYQAFCQRLALNGFVVLIYDPINQGERDQYADLSDRQAVTACTSAHNMMGKQQELVGEFFGMWRVWDGIRALDYMLARPEVDAQRVGLTGNSGGGTVATWLWAIDDRFTMAAPGCFVTTFLANLENELPADCEQYPPGVLGQRLEIADFIIAGAPKPVLLLGQRYDFFDRRGLDEATEEITQFYQVLGAPADHVDMFRGPHDHGYHVENQEQMVAFFAKHAGISYRPTETALLDAEELFVTERGDVLAVGAKPVYRFTAEVAARLSPERPQLVGCDLVDMAGQLLGIETLPSTPHHRNLRPTVVSGVRCARYAIETEGNVRAILYKAMPNSGLVHSLDVDGNVALYLPHFSSAQDIGSLQGHMSDESEELYLLDVRGLGESAPDEEGAFWQPYGMDYMLHGYELLFGQSYLGRRVWDALSAVALLFAEGAEHIRIEGRGQGAIIALFAALLDERIEHVLLRNAPQSYQEWTEAPLVMWPAANMLRGVLCYFDLGDCRAALADRVSVVDPWDALMLPAQ